MGNHCPGSFSNCELRFTLLPPLTLSFRSQSLNPAFFTLTVCSPSVTCTSEGVLPTKLPSTSMSASVGSDSICSFPLVPGLLAAAPCAGVHGPR
jgi:hypothetical protein